MVRRRTLLTFLLATVAALAVATVQEPPFEGEIKAFERADAAKMPPPGAILFTGSSSIRLWSTLAQDFPNHVVLNRGFGGSEVGDSVRLADRTVLPYKPKAVVFFAGTNDLANGKTPEKVAADYRAFVEKVRATMPDLPIAYIAITPAPSRWNNIANVRLANAYVKAYSESVPGLRFIDTYPRMVNAIGGPRVELFGPDNLHMNPTGYALWREIVGPVVDEMDPTPAPKP